MNVERNNNYDHALNRFQGWLAPRLNADGSLKIPGPSCIAYQPLALYAYATGNRELHARTLSFLESECSRNSRFLEPDGKAARPYRPAWLIMGAVVGERFRLAAALENWILRFQDARTGGFFGTGAKRDAGAGAICFDSTTQACAALCYTGNLAAAERSGNFLRKLVRDQPNPDQRLLCVWHSKRGLVTEFGAKAAFAHVIEWRKPLQCLYKIGLLVRALACLYARTGITEYLTLAESLQRRAAVTAPDVWTNTLAHKLGWSAWTLLGLTRKPEYAEQACRVADHLVTLQQPDGGFHYPEFWPPYDTVELEEKMNIGFQFATWIASARSASSLLTTQP